MAKTRRHGKRASRKARKGTRKMRGGEFTMKGFMNKQGISPPMGSTTHSMTTVPPMNLSTSANKWRMNTKPKKTWKNRFTPSNNTRKRVSNALFRVTPSQEKQNWMKNKGSKAANLTKRGAIAVASGVVSGAKGVGRGIKGIGKAIADPLVSGSLVNLLS